MTKKQFMLKGRNLLRLLVVVVILFSFVAIHPSASAATLDTFTVTSTSPANQVAYGNGMFVTVSGYELQYSADGYNWTSIPAASNQFYTDVTFADGRFVVICGSSKAALSSTDGIHWTSVTMPSGSYMTPWLNKVIYANGKYYILGSEYDISLGRNINTIYSSPDAQNWTIVMETADATIRAHSIVYNSQSGGFMALSGVTQAFTSASGDLNTWSTVSTGSIAVSAAATGNNMLVGLGVLGPPYNALYYWDNSNSPGTWSPFATVNLYSTNGLKYVNNRWFAFGDATASGVNPMITVSDDDGATWTTHSVPAASYIRDVAYGNGVYVVTGYNCICTTNPDRSVTYNGNTATGGSAPTDSTVYHFGDSATILDNTGSLVKDGYTFDGWNTRADGSGSSFSGGSSTNISGDLLLYAQWRSNTATATPVPDAVIPATGDGSNVPLLLSLSLFVLIGLAISCAWFIRKRNGYK